MGGARGERLAGRAGLGGGRRARRSLEEGLRGGRGLGE